MAETLDIEQFNGRCKKDAQSITTMHSSMVKSKSKYAEENVKMHQSISNGSLIE